MIDFAESESEKQRGLLAVNVSASLLEISMVWSTAKLTLGDGGDEKLALDHER
jgi:hypothetical protein